MKYVLKATKVLACVGLAVYAQSSWAVVYCTGPGFPVGCVVRPVDRGAPGVGEVQGLGCTARARCQGRIRTLLRPPSWSSATGAREILAA